MKKVIIFFLSVQFFSSSCSKDCQYLNTATKSLYFTKTDFNKISFLGNETTIQYGLELYRSSSKSIQEDAQKRILKGDSFMVDVFLLDIQAIREF